MKKILYSLLLTSLVLVVSSSFSFAQQERQRANAELDVVKSKKIQSDVRKAVQKESLQYPPDQLHLQIFREQIL